MKLNNTRTFTRMDTVIDLIDTDCNIIPLLSRFGIPLGFGDKTIGEVCDDNGLDSGIFLLVINFTMAGVIPAPEKADIHTAVGIVDFLHNSHDYFSSYKFPHIRTNLINALDPAHADINPAIIRFFDDYVEHIKDHFDYEEQIVWPYIRGLQDGTPANYDIGTFRSHHEESGEKLADLKNIIMRYYTTSMPYKMYDALVDIFNCEEDLDTHRDIENRILIPLIAAIEQSGKHHCP